MGLDIYFREDIARVLLAVAIARDGLTEDERTLLVAICAGFGLSRDEIPLKERQVAPIRHSILLLGEEVEL